MDEVGDILVNRFVTVKFYNLGSTRFSKGSLSIHALWSCTLMLGELYFDVL